MRHLISLADLSTKEIDRVFAITDDLKAKFAEGLREPLLPGRVLALIFEKASLRTRVSFEAGMTHLGGTSLMLGDDCGFGKRESIEDFARVLSEYVDAVVLRVAKHETAEAFARHAECSIINGLTDREHPCQALADIYTLRERWDDLRGGKLAYVGDGNNVARSLAIGCGRMGIEMALATPEGYQFDDEFLARLHRETPDLKLSMTRDPAEAVCDADAIYTDVWASMGQESERAERGRIFSPYQVTADLLSEAKPDAVFLHCLPARRGEEVTDDVIDGPQSAVIEQAANRMHVQKGILVWMLGAHG